jgi:hypothetical protein
MSTKERGTDLRRGTNFVRLFAADRCHGAANYSFKGRRLLIFLLNLKIFFERNFDPAKVYRSEAGFLSNEFPHCTSETVKARSFPVRKNIFVLLEKVQLL